MIVKQIRAKQLEWKRVELWEKFVREFSTIKSRYPIFVCEGYTRTAKSSWAANLEGDPDKVFFVNAACCEEPDLRAFDYLKHPMILFDEASPKMVLRQKLLFQGPPVWVRLGMSATACHAYDVFVSGTKMVICSNKWQDEKSQLCQEDQDWLNENTYYFNTGKEPLFVTPQPSLT